MLQFPLLGASGFINSSSQVDVWNLNPAGPRSTAPLLPRHSQGTSLPPTCQLCSTGNSCGQTGVTEQHARHPAIYNQIKMQRESSASRQTAAPRWDQGEEEQGCSSQRCRSPPCTQHRWGRCRHSTMPFVSCFLVHTPQQGMKHRDLIQMPMGFMKCSSLVSSVEMHGTRKSSSCDTGSLSYS